MASWMVHLRIADLLMCEFDNLEDTEFVVGNLEREYPYLNEKQMDKFVEETVGIVAKWVFDL